MRSLTGFGTLLRFVLWRDRLRAALWVVGVVGMVVASAAALPPVYPDQAAIDQYAELVGGNLALIAFAGPGYGLDHPTIGAILVNETQVFAFISVALMSIFMVNRHTRAEEDTERADLVRSAVVGRHAPTAAAVVAVGALNVVVGLLCAIGFVLTGYEVVGSMALAASFVAIGLVFTGVAAVAVQVASTGRAALGLASSAVGLAFVVRAVGDISGSRLSWLSPMGWAQAVRAFADERWWTLLLCLVVAVALVVLAFWLSTVRDLGAGIVATRLGSPAWRGSRPGLLGLAIRLQRGAFLGWTIGLFLLGAVMGSLAGDIEDMIGENPTFDAIFAATGGNIVDSYLATTGSLLALAAAGFAIASVLRLHGEETAGRAEPVLAAAPDRTRWIGSHLVIAVVGTIAVLAASGLGTGLAALVVTGETSIVGRSLGAALVAAPAVLVLVGIALALFGAVPWATPAAWVALAYATLVGYLGEVLRLPDWSKQLSPLEHVPALPAEDLRVAPLVVLSALAAGLAVAGTFAFHHRDVAAH